MIVLKPKKQVRHFAKNECRVCGFTYLDYTNSDRCSPWCRKYRPLRVMRPGNKEGNQKRN